MGTGYLIVQVTDNEEALPVAGAEVKIYSAGGALLYTTATNANGITAPVALSAPPKELTLDPNYLEPAYSVYDVTVTARGIVAEHIRGVQIVDTQTSILPVRALPLESEPGGIREIEINIPPVGLLIPVQNRQAEIPPAQSGSPEAGNEAIVSVMAMPAEYDPAYQRMIPSAEPVPAPQPRVMRGVIIPDYITVHLGIPTNAAARNVRVRFPDYIKNVVSSEIYSTWPYNSLVANTHAIVTFALNRVYTEWYRSRGFNFDMLEYKKNPGDKPFSIYSLLYNMGLVRVNSFKKFIENY